MGLWVDYWFLLVFGGIPWQCYYQRVITIYIIITTTINNHISHQIKPTISKVLSSKTANRAMFLSYGGAAIALIMTGRSIARQQQITSDFSRSIRLIWSNCKEHKLGGCWLPLWGAL